MVRRVGFRLTTPVAWLFTCAALVSCSAIFGIDEANHRNGGSGTGARSGNANGGASAQGGSPRGGSETGGVGGRSGGSANGGASGNAGAGGGGDGGEGGVVDPGPILGDRCTGDETETGTSCTPANSRLVLQCNPNTFVWEERATCDLFNVCVPEYENGDHEWVDAQCQALEDPCRYGSLCGGANRLIDCDTVPFDVVWRECPFGCRDAACLPGTGDQLIVHTGEPDLAPGDVRVLPVCVVGLSENRGLVDAIRDEVELTWARILDRDFPGWEECEDELPDPGIAISFTNGCRGRLVNDIRRRSQTDGLIQLEFCRSYFDVDPNTVDPAETSPELLRMLAVHQFGHAVGIFDNKELFDVFSVMRHGLELSRLDVLELTPFDRMRARNSCGDGYGCRKHPGAIVTAKGRCLEVNGDGSIGSGSCVAPAAPVPSVQHFRLEPGQIMSLDGGTPKCFGTWGGHSELARVRVADCSMMPILEPFDFRRVQWSSYGRCVAPLDGSVEAGTPLVIGSCEPVGTPSQSWRFEITETADEALTARIHFDDVWCVTLPGGVASGVIPLELELCGSVDSSWQTFRLRSDYGTESPQFGDTIGFGSDIACVDWGTADGALWVDEMCQSSMRWVLTGPLETASGLALSLSGAGPARVAVLDGILPERDQIFDFYF